MLMVLCSTSVTSAAIVSFLKNENNCTKIHMKFSNIWGTYSKMDLKPQNIQAEGDPT